MDSHLLEDCQILEVGPGISPKELQRAYHDMLKVWHPDRFPHDSALAAKAQEKTKRINLAYERLKAFLSIGGSQKQGFNSHGNQTGDRAENSFKIGVQHLTGDGAPLNYDEAVKWLLQSVELGYAPAKDALGWCYANGLGVPVDVAQAFRLFYQAAEEGYAGAEWKVGYAYEAGVGIRMNKAEAVRWYYKSAHHEDPEGQYRLALMLLTGEGVLQNITEAQQWFGKASQAGHPKATEELQRTRSGRKPTDLSPPPTSRTNPPDTPKPSDKPESSDHAAGVGCILFLLIIAFLAIFGISSEWMHTWGKAVFYLCIGVVGSIAVILGRKK